MEKRERIGHLPPFGLRMPSEIREWVMKKAYELDRSQNYVILKAIEAYIKSEKVGVNDQAAA